MYLAISYAYPSFIQPYYRFSCYAAKITEDLLLWLHKPENVHGIKLRSTHLSRYCHTNLAISYKQAIQSVVWMNINVACMIHTERHLYDENLSLR